MNRREFLSAGAAASFLKPGPTPQRLPAEDGLIDRSGAWIDVDLDRIGFNLQQIRKRARGRKVMAVVKANAYGHGLAGVGRYLDRQGIDGLMVVNLQEAITLRGAGGRASILNFGPVPDEGLDRSIEADITQMVCGRAVDRLSGRAQALGTRVPVHIDTGLGRVGVPYRDAAAFIEHVVKLPGVRVEGVMTGFTEDHDFDQVQLERFEEIVGWASSKGIDLGIRHASSSAALVDYDERFLLDMVRPGITVYGHYPSGRAAEARVIELKPSLSLKSRILFSKTLQEGDSVSYHRAYVAKGPTPVVTIPVGYSDGYPGNLVGVGSVLVGGRRHKLIGAITANHAIAELEGVEAAEGEIATLIGKQDGTFLAAEEIAAQAQVSVYRLLIGLNPLLPRVYHRG